MSKEEAWDRTFKRIKEAIAHDKQVMHGRPIGEVSYWHGHEHGLTEALRILERSRFE